MVLDREHNIGRDPAPKSIPSDTWHKKTRGVEWGNGPRVHGEMYSGQMIRNHTTSTSFAKFGVWNDLGKCLGEFSSAMPLVSECFTNVLGMAKQFIPFSTCLLAIIGLVNCKKPQLHEQNYWLQDFILHSTNIWNCLWDCSGIACTLDAIYTNPPKPSCITIRT